jgi:hypothetical protein
MTRIRVLSLIAGALSCTLAFLVWNGSEQAAPDTPESVERDSARMDPDRVARTKAHLAARKAENELFAAARKKRLVDARINVRVLANELRAKFADLEQDSANKKLEDEVAKLSREYDSAVYYMLRLDGAYPYRQEPELGGSCAFPLRGSLK